MHTCVLRSIVPASEVHNGCFYSPAVPVRATPTFGGDAVGGGRWERMRTGWQRGRGLGRQGQERQGHDEEGEEKEDGEEDADAEWRGLGSSGEWERQRGECAAATAASGSTAPDGHGARNEFVCSRSKLARPASTLSWAVRSSAQEYITKAVQPTN